jgi:ubiquinone/menaquinone biosynthesis C-methylase UbiE
MSFYSRVVFPRLCELALDWPWVAERRQDALSGAHGEILEIGIGTGLNLANYPAHVRRLTAIEPNPAMSRRAAARATAKGIDVDYRTIKGESLPFAEATFDTVVSTFTLCSIAGVETALGEIHRVLKPGGSFVFLEHGISPEPSVARWQRRLNRLQMLVGDNCHLDRDIEALVRGQPFAGFAAESAYLERGPRTHGYVTQGTAVK